MEKIRAVITCVGGFVPDTRLTNKDLEKMVETTDEWIKTRTGIESRGILTDPTKGSSYLGTMAVKNILKKKNLDPNEIDCIICATVTPDMHFPANANLISFNVGAKNAFGFDMNAACSGFLFALTVGTSFIESGRYKNVIVVGADKMSTIVDYTDRSSCILFGDGAGAVLLQPSFEEFGVLDSILKSDGIGAEFLKMKSGGSLNPPSLKTVTNNEHVIYQEGQSVFRYAVKGMADVSADLMLRNNLTADDIAYLVPHQANFRIIDATANRMGISRDKVMINIQKYGNTTDATIPLCLWDWEDKLKKGDNLIFAAFGGGFTWGATWVKWGY